MFFFFNSSVELRYFFMIVLLTPCLWSDNIASESHGSYLQAGTVFGPQHGKPLICRSIDALEIVKSKVCQRLYPCICIWNYFHT